MARRDRTPQGRRRDRKSSRDRRTGDVAGNVDDDVASQAEGVAHRGPFAVGDVRIVNDVGVVVDGLSVENRDGVAGSGDRFVFTGAARALGVRGLKGASGVIRNLLKIAKGNRLTIKERRVIGVRDRGGNRNDGGGERKTTV